MKFIKYKDNRKIERYIPMSAILTVQFIDDNIKWHSVISITPISDVITIENTTDIQLKYKKWDKYYNKVKNYFVKNS